MSVLELIEVVVTTLVLELVVVEEGELVER